jgi:hypothetical protein
MTSIFLEVTGSLADIPMGEVPPVEIVQQPPPVHHDEARDHRRLAIGEVDRSCRVLTELEPIGNGGCILSGVTIGDGAVVGARAVVTKDMPPYSVVVGNPAQTIRYRFSEIQIQKLLHIPWWNWSLEKLKNNADLLLGDELDEFLAKHQTIEAQPAEDSASRGAVTYTRLVPRL